MCQIWRKSVPGGILGKWWNISLTKVFIYLFIRFCTNSPTGQTRRRIFTLDGSNDADSRKDVSFGGFVDTALHFDVMFKFLIFDNLIWQIAAIYSESKNWLNVLRNYTMKHYKILTIKQQILILKNCSLSIVLTVRDQKPQKSLKRSYNSASRWHSGNVMVGNITCLMIKDKTGDINSLDIYRSIGLTLSPVISKLFEIVVLDICRDYFYYRFPSVWF